MPGMQVHSFEGAVALAIVLLIFYSLFILAMIVVWRYDFKIGYGVGTVHFKVSKWYQLAACKFLYSTTASNRFANAEGTVRISLGILVISISKREDPRDWGLLFNPYFCWSDMGLYCVSMAMVKQAMVVSGVKHTKRHRNIIEYVWTPIATVPYLAGTYVDLHAAKLESQGSNDQSIEPWNLGARVTMGLGLSLMALPALVVFPFFFRAFVDRWWKESRYNHIYWLQSVAYLVTLPLFAVWAAAVEIRIWLLYQPHTAIFMVATVLPELAITLMWFYLGAVITRLDCHSYRLPGKIRSSLHFVWFGGQGRPGVLDMMELYVKTPPEWRVLAKFWKPRLLAEAERLCPEIVQHGSVPAELGLTLEEVVNMVNAWMYDDMSTRETYVHLFANEFYAVTNGVPGQCSVQDLDEFNLQLSSNMEECRPCSENHTTYDMEQTRRIITWLRVLSEVAIENLQVTVVTEGLRRGNPIFYIDLERTKAAIKDGLRSTATIPPDMIDELVERWTLPIVSERGPPLVTEAARRDVQFSHLIQFPR